MLQPTLDKGGSGAASDFLEEMRRFRPRQTVFEIGNTARSSRVREVMAEKRVKHAGVIEKRRKRGKSRRTRSWRRKKKRRD